MRPMLVLRPVIPHHAAGRRTEPPVSVPMAQGAMRAATATADPLLEPPGVRAILRSHGFQGVPRCWLVPQPPKANSTVCVLPMTIMPALISFRASVAVRLERRSRQTALPPVVTRPSSSIRSLRATGMPCSGPTPCPERMALWAASAASRASLANTSTKACSLPSSRSMRCRQASTISTGEMLRLISFSASVASERCARSVAMSVSQKSLAVGTPEHGIQQQVSPRERAVELDVFLGVVADTVAAGRKNHGRWREVCDRVGIVTGLAQHFAVAQPQIGRGVLQQADALGGEQRGAPAPSLDDRHADACLGFCHGDRRPNFAVHALEARGVGMAEVDQQPHRFGYDAGQVGKAFDARRRGAPFLASEGKSDIVHGGNQITGTDQRIAALEHGRAAAVARFSRNSDAQGERLVAADHDTNIAALAIELRCLFDVQLQITVEAPVAERRRAEIADALEFIAKAQALIVQGGVHLGRGKLAGERKRAHQRRTEASAFLVRPHDELDGPARRHAAVVQAPDHLEPAEHAERAIVSAATDLRVEMAADGNRRQGIVGPRPAGEDVADAIDLDATARLPHPANEEIAYLLVLWR